MLSRFKSAARILLRGESEKRKRTQIPAITPEEVAEIKKFFPREKFFIFGHARSGTTLLMRLARLHPKCMQLSAHFFTRNHCSNHWWIHPSGGVVGAQVPTAGIGTRPLAAGPACRRGLHHGTRDAAKEGN